MKRIFAALLLMAIIPAIAISQPWNDPWGGGESVPKGASDGQVLTWDFANNKTAWSSSVDPDMLAGDTTDDDAIDTAILSADAQASLGLADSAVQPGDLSTIATSGDITDATGTLSISNGGTGATTAAGALTNLGLAPIDPSTAAGQMLVGDVAGGWDVASGISYLNGVLTLPLGDNSADPSFVFNGGTKIVSETTSSLRILDNSDVLLAYISNNGIRIGVNNTLGLFRNSIASSTNPVFCPVGGTTGTGVGSASSTELSLIANSVEGLRVAPTVATLGGTVTTDIVPSNYTLKGASALAGATVNQDGADLTITAGDSATAGGDGGNLILYGGNGTTNDGVVRLANPTVPGTAYVDLAVDASDNLSLTADFVGINVNPPTNILHLRGGEISSTYQGQLRIDDDTAQAAGVGGGILFGLKYTDAGDYTYGGQIRSYKENATSGNTYSGLQFKVRGASVITGMFIDSSGRIIVPNMPTSDPSVAGALWSNSGVINISSGP